MTIDVIVSFALTSLVMAISLGPDVMYVLSQSISKGRNFGIAAALGLSTGLLFHTTLLAFGITTLVTAIPWLFTLIKIFGSCYLLWLAFNVYRKPNHFDVVKASGENSNPLSNVGQGLLMNIMNPKVMLFFLALFPSFLDASSHNMVFQIYTLGSIAMIQALIVFVIYAVVASSLTKFLRDSITFNLVLKWLQIVVFVSLALFMLF